MGDGDDTRGVNRSLAKVLRRHGLSRSYPREVEREVSEIVAAPGIDDPSLDDMTSLPFVTIDNEESRDLDQALQIEREGKGTLVRYALADASYYVRPGMALFAEALRRGTSYYLPGLVVPMLPPQLSEDIISLAPKVDRRAMVFEMHLDRDGECHKTRIRRARIHSRDKLSYNGVQRFHDHPDSDPLADRDFTDSLELLREVGEVRMALSRERDVVQFRRQEAVIERGDGSGRGFRIVEDLRNDVSLWNEQLSLLCNIEGGRFLAVEPHPDVQPIYRIHDAPSPESLNHLERIIAQLVDIHGLDPKRWTWLRRGKVALSLADYLDGLPLGGATGRIRQAIEQQILVVNQRSHYSAEPGRHFALGVRPYTRFSAPMREIVGIFTHKEALEKLGLITPSATPTADEELREQIIASANGSRERQNRITKDVTKLAVDELLGDDLGLPLDERPRYRGTIIGIRPTRLYVQLDEPAVALKVYLDHLERQLGQRFAICRDDLELAPFIQASAPIFNVGDEITLRCLGYDEKAEKWEIGMVAVPGTQ
jgi:ribonuclease R